MRAAPTLGSQRFRAEREASWTALEALLEKAERKSVSGLDDDELLSLPTLYRATLSSLSVARAVSLDADLIAYLEGLSARAYFFVYGVRSSFWRRLRTFFGRDWPGAVRALLPETLASTMLLIAGAAIGYLLVTAEPGWYRAFVPDELAGDRGVGSSAASLRATLYGGKEQPLAAFAAFLFTHNAQVAIGAFALGFAFGVPTAMLILYTGCMMGAFVALFSGHGLGFELGGWLFIHGSSELFAILIAGAAGFRIGRSIAFPGELTRAAAAQAAGRVAGTAMTGVVLMLVVAGLLEGFGRQLVTDDGARYGIGGIMLALWLAYFYVMPRRG